MDAWVVDHTAPIDDGPLRRLERDQPEPGPGQFRVRVSCCGVCRTDLHLAEGDLPPKRPAVTPGHEIVGYVDAVGTGGALTSDEMKPGPLMLQGDHTTIDYRNIVLKPVIK